MGFRVHLNSANSIGHLIEGNVKAFLQLCGFYDEYKKDIIDYFDDFFSDDFSDFISSNPYLFDQRKRNLSLYWKEIKLSFENYSKEEEEEEYDLNRFMKDDIFYFFKKVSNLLGDFQYKFLLLPGFEINDLNTALTSKMELLKLIRYESTYSYLIIQLKDIPQRSEVTVLNSFNQFQLALDRINEWPGILMWTNFSKIWLIKNFLLHNYQSHNNYFLPLKDEKQLFEFFEHFALNKSIDAYVSKKIIERDNKDLIQIVHLSDLHLGSKNEEEKLRRLKYILKRLKSKLKKSEKLITLISGDLIDTPKINNEHKYLNFEDDLVSFGYKPIIKVLGNHDTRIGGIISFTKTTNAIIANFSSRGPIEIFEDLKLIILKFNSNESGNLARGRISKAQLSEMGNQLSNIPDYETYCIIALLHHHPFEIVKPDWMKKKWYDYIYGLSYFINISSVKLIDADLFISWLKSYNIKFVIHGHEHIPILFKNEGINVISAGSSMGRVNPKNKSDTFLTYNVINYDVNKRKPVSCTIYVEKQAGTPEIHYQYEAYA